MNPTGSETSGPALAVAGLSAGYPGRPVLEDVGFTVERGVLAGVLGPNGAGKSTLLKAVLGLLPGTRGEVVVLGAPLARRRGRVAYVPQRSSVDWDFPATVRDVVVMGRYGKLPWWRWPGSRDRAAAEAALARVGLSDLLDRRISDLSGGQQQRVFLARALAQEAELYMLDEPLAGVDAASEAVIVELLRALAREGRSVVMVHHDLHTARRYFDRLLLVNRGIVAVGATEAVFTPELLQKTYGGQLLAFGDQVLVVEG